MLLLVSLLILVMISSMSKGRSGDGDESADESLSNILLHSAVPPPTYIIQSMRDMFRICWCTEIQINNTDILMHI